MQCTLNLIPIYAKENLAVEDIVYNVTTNSPTHATCNTQRTLMSRLRRYEKLEAVGEGIVYNNVNAHGKSQPSTHSGFVARNTKHARATRNAYAKDTRMP